MKKVVYASNQPNKTQLRKEFVSLASQVRDLSKFQFVDLLSNNDFATAQQWINELQSTLDYLAESAQSNLDYVVSRVIVDGKFVGYVESFKESSVRGYKKCTIDVTRDIEDAQVFSSARALNQQLSKDQDIKVYLDDIGYNYERRHLELAGQLDEISTGANDIDVFYVGDVQFEPEQL